MPRHLYKIIVATACLVCLLSHAHAQSPRADSTLLRYDSLAKIKLAHIDSFGNRVNNKIDSLQGRFNRLLNPSVELNASAARKLFRARKKQQDSVTSSHHLDSVKLGVNHRIDSLKSLNLPTEKYTRKLDSLNNISPEKYLEQVQGKIDRPGDQIEGKINEKLSAINKEAGPNSNLPGSVDLNKNLELPGTSLKTDALKIPSPDLKVGNPLSNIKNPLGDELNQAGEVKGKLGNITQAPQREVDQLKSMGEVKNLQGKAGKLNEITDKTQGYGSDVKNIASGNAGDVQKIPDAIENKAKGLNEIKELENHQGFGEMDKYKGMAGAANDPEVMAELAKKQALTYSRDHFVGQEKALQAAMDHLTKLKKKYPDMPSVADMKKRVYNSMHGKPFVERIVPGLTLQVQKTNNVLIDLNPVASYRLSGVWNAGLGWNERLSFHKWNQLAPLDRIYGPRAFTSVAITKGLGVKIEGERMNAYVPISPLSVDTGRRKWVWSLFVGIKKDYRISKWVHGNVQILYNLYDDHDNSPYSDRLNVRMGFEIPMKKNAGKPEQHSKL